MPDIPKHTNGARAVVNTAPRSASSTGASKGSDIPHARNTLQSLKFRAYSLSCEPTRSRAPEAPTAPTN
jgi:hypothetical protein